MLKLANAYGMKFLVPPNDEGVGSCLLEAGEFARVELEFILASCDGNLLDVGANIGAIGLPFAARRPNAKVIAIEAHRDIAEILQANVNLNGLTNVDVIHAAAGEREGEADIPIPPVDRIGNIGAGSLYDAGYPTLRTKFIPLDSLKASNPSLVKIDVEGFEPHVLQGSNDLLKIMRPNWLIEISRRRPENFKNIRSILELHNYSIYWFFSPFLTPQIGRPGDFRGDFAIFASDNPPPWPLARCGTEWPTSEKLLPYLSDRRLFSTNHL
jgi:FkbM family methyltransferase